MTKFEWRDPNSRRNAPAENLSKSSIAEGGRSKSIELDNMGETSKLVVGG